MARTEKNGDCSNKTSQLPSGLKNVAGAALAANIILWAALTTGAYEDLF